MRTSLPVDEVCVPTRCCTHMGLPTIAPWPASLSLSLTLWGKEAIKLTLCWPWLSSALGPPWGTVAQTRPDTDYKSPLWSRLPLLSLPLSSRQTQNITQLGNDINVLASFACKHKVFSVPQGYFCQVHKKALVCNMMHQR